MYPIDTVKTRVQASTLTTWQVCTTIWRERGAMGFMRGSTVIGFGCIPAHIGLFSTYEWQKAQLLDLEGSDHQPVRAAMCGASATVAHDVILTPSDVVKQRLQMGGYRGAFDCVASIARLEGASAFYRSLPATLAMNVPYMGLLVAANESLKRTLDLNAHAEEEADSSKLRISRIGWHFLTAAVSGGVAASLTLPLDVVKTRLQTQGGTFDAVAASDANGFRSPRYSGIISTMQAIKAQEGMAGFFRGLGPRIMLAVPSAAMCWGTYETVRALLHHYTTTPEAAFADSEVESK